MGNDATETDALLAGAAAGDAEAWGALLVQHQHKLERIVTFRMDPRLRQRIEPADVVQDAFVEAAAHREAYFRTDAPLLVWLRGVVTNKLRELHRHHLGTRMRDARRDLPLDGAARGSETSAAVCIQLTAGLTRVSIAAARDEVHARLLCALDSMDETDREVLALRHFEQLSSSETAQVLKIQERAAAKRYLRALARLKQILSEMPGGLTELRL